jgi:hypothetical protein
MFHFLLGFVAGCPSGKGFLVNGHDVDARRNYSFPSTRHTSIDNTTVGKLEHNIAGAEALAQPFARRVQSADRPW